MTLYVPMFRWKRGERTGLEALDATTKSGVLPFIDISGDRFRGKKATKQKPATTAPVQFIDDAKRLGFQKLLWPLQRLLQINLGSILSKTSLPLALPAASR